MPTFQSKLPHQRDNVEVPEEEPFVSVENEMAKHYRDTHSYWGLPEVSSGSEDDQDKETSSGK